METKIKTGESAVFEIPKRTDSPDCEYLSVRVVVCGGFLELHVEGYGEHAAEPGEGVVVFLEHYDGKLWLRYSPDILRDNVEGVDLEGAAESRRSPASEPRLNRWRGDGPSQTSAEAIFVKTRVERAEKPDDITVDSIIYDWNVWGYRVFLRYAGITVFEYSAGNHAGDSQVFVHPTSDNAVPEAQLGRFAAQTAECFGAEYGVPPEEIRREPGLADTLEEATPVSGTKAEDSPAIPRGFISVRLPDSERTDPSYVAVSSIVAVHPYPGRDDLCCMQIRESTYTAVGTVQEIMAKIAAAVG